MPFPSEEFRSALLQWARYAVVEAVSRAQLPADIPQSTPAPIRLEEIEIGKHGLIVVSGGRRGLLLPQVATQHGLDPQRFLEETCRKAGLPPEAWREAGTQILGFTCEVFAERSSGSGQ